MSQKKEPITFFIDHCVSQKIVPNALQSAGAIVETHRDHFPIDALDTEWLTEVSQRGWVFITKDWALNSNFLEQRAIAAANARVFILTSGNYTGEQMATILVNALRGLQKFVQGNQAPFIARILSNGQVQMHHNHTKLRKLLK